MISFEGRVGKCEEWVYSAGLFSACIAIQTMTCWGLPISARSMSAGEELNSFTDVKDVCVSIHAHLFHY